MKSRIHSYLYIATVILFLGILFFSREYINCFLSNMQVRNVTETKKESMADTIAGRYNYNYNGGEHQITFLEFGATTCHSCKLMEKVMEEIQDRYKEEVNVVFVNITQPENKDIVEYFGITTIPSQVVLDRNGKEYFRHSGYISTDDLDASLKRGIDAGSKGVIMNN